MDNFEERLLWILEDLKGNKIDYYEATLRIEELIVSNLEFVSYFNHKYSEWEEQINGRIPEWEFLYMVW